MHLIRWDMLTKRKRDGGVNLKPAREMNWAMLAKMAWRVLTSRGEVWSEVLKAKYGVKESEGAYFKERHGESFVWKGVVRGAELLRRGLKWQIGDGMKARFWADTWLEQTPLQSIIQHQLSDEQMNMKVRDYWVEGVGWQWSNLQESLTASTLMNLASKTLAGVEENEDIFRWLDRGLNFKVSEAFKIAMSWPRGEE